MQALRNHWRSLLAFLSVIWTIQFISSFITLPAVSGWYKSIEKAPWNPPDWVFGPVWTILYIMIALSGWVAWRKLSGTTREKLSHTGFVFYALQLLFNFAWSIIFFGLKMPALALVDIVLLLASITLTMYHFKKIDRTSGVLLVPYFLWVAYATTLNAAIAYLN